MVLIIIIILLINFSDYQDGCLNVKGSFTESKTGSARQNGSEEDGVENKQVNINLKKWLNDNLKFKSTIYSRQTETDYDNSVSLENNYTADDRMYAFQAGFDYKKDNKEDTIIFHYNKYDREYNENGSLDNIIVILIAKSERVKILTRYLTVLDQNINMIGEDLLTGILSII